ncbi:MAG TPA: DNA mismatch repair protein MutS [Acidiphilium sp.]|nr:MAG: DNA mismatch repair protein MutS [Acidiphilium sp. 21-60-14]OYV90982.1 MAG: DNA mismatch repair protein MutS [Acidiphilium sp. 37-60-79]OZB38894.1 MAG: DNA mismatch repair protein MutS [Acidiphilium sp. 34-60-192]HQT88594.1 DNA mismatch repair protein MutS [Acidiphilium sp.]HQU24532.1 DNA mismatch repair protein MutS [Acidiphilium sp.]
MDEAQSAGATPAMAQWFRAKADYPEALIFFRMGDFYEMFFEDAEIAAGALDIALTARGQHQGQPISMCGVPVGQRDVYLARLVRRGFSVAIVEQMEVPASDKARGAARGGKTLIERAVVRLITPGTLTEEALLDAGQTRLLVALVADEPGDQYGVAWIDASTGRFETEAVARGALAALLARLDPAEILAGPTIDLGLFAGKRAQADGLIAGDRARALLATAFGVASIEAFGAFSDSEVRAAALALRHVQRSQGGAAGAINLVPPVRVSEAGLLAMDAATRASLDLLRDRNGQEAGSLFGAVRRTVSAAGARCLAQWIAAPLDDLAALRDRQALWLGLAAMPGRLAALRVALRGAADLARALTRLRLAGDAVRPVSPRDLGLVRDALAVADQVDIVLDGAMLVGFDWPDRPRGLRDELTRALVASPPIRAGDAPAIAPGFDGELDGERALRDDARQVIAALQTELARRYGVASLKIRHHAQLGYVIEVPTASVEGLRAFPELLLRQGLAAAARFSHPEVSALDQRIAEASERAARREAVVLAALRRRVLAEASALGLLASALAVLDAAQSAADLASAGRWCAPELSADAQFQIVAGRHPVVEAALGVGQRFIANDSDLGPERRLLLLTGPNMAGKSTFLRQNALMLVLAQAGLPVPAERALIGLADRLFSRVGAADDLAAGRSTFMVEMIETAAILNQAGPRSFVIIDEIGRGTGTRDGLAIAQAVLEALHGTIRCRAIFATHFHDLVPLVETLPRAALGTMRVKEWRGEVVFMHEVIEGAAGRSWGVHVAKLAGVPPLVVRRAADLLQAAERGEPALPLFERAPEADSATEMSAARDAEFLAALRAIDPDRLSPRAALETIYALRRNFLGDPPADALDE